VCSQLNVRELKPADILIREDEDPKEFFVVAEGTLLSYPAGLKVNIKVLFRSP
jgi:hypothetical protein